MFWMSCAGAGCCLCLAGAAYLLLRWRRQRRAREALGVGKGGGRGKLPPAAHASSPRGAMISSPLTSTLKGSPAMRPQGASPSSAYAVNNPMQLARRSGGSTSKDARERLTARAAVAKDYVGSVTGGGGGRAKRGMSELQLQPS